MKIKKNKYWLVGGFVAILLAFVLEILVVKICTSDIFCLVLGWFVFLPGAIIERLFSLNPDISFFGIYLRAYISLIFWFIIGALVGILIGKLFGKSPKK
ncbi:unnamed protein product [marine sediment metagenome]|uniref:Uncharacterized protein n=1 Tax=marine sediment metagenome TaxID=412755 RepID=X0WYH7_9ZZZZ